MESNFSTLRSQKHFFGGEINDESFLKSVENISPLYYKLVLLNSFGNPEQVIVFGNDTGISELDFFPEKNTGKNQNTVDSEDKIKIKVTHSRDNIMIQSDDSIRVIKKKIVHHIGVDKISYDEIYCFIKILQFLDGKEVYDSSLRTIKDENTEYLNKNAVNQILINLGIYVEQDVGENKETHLNFEEFSAKLMDYSTSFPKNLLLPSGDDFPLHAMEKGFLPTLRSGENVNPEESIKLFMRSISLGQRTESSSNDGEYLTPSNPFTVYSNELLKQPMVFLDNELLLNYGEPDKKIIYVCLAEDVFSNISLFGNEKITNSELQQLGLPSQLRNSSEQSVEESLKTKKVRNKNDENDVESKIIMESQGELYTNRFFPFLYKNNKNINSLETLRENKNKLLSKNKTIINKDVLLLYKTVDSFYKVYEESRKSYIEDVPDEIQKQVINVGIKEFQLRIKHPSKGKSAFSGIPLDVLFKNIHASKNIPLIKFNPGMRRENIYRIFTKQRTLNGKYLSYLPENQVLKLSKTIGKHRGIFLYIKNSYLGEQDGENDPDFYMIIHSNGDINIHSILNVPLSNQKLLQVLQSNINPVIKDMNRFLNKTGYSINVINSLNQPHLEVFYIKYTMDIKMEYNFVINDYIGCISSIFTILENKLTRDGSLVMLFKRVENFQEMEQQSMLITELLKKTDNITVVIDALVQNFKLTQEEAQVKLVDYYNEHPDARGKIIENSGFPVSIQTQSLDGKMTIVVDNIISLNYLENLNIYLYSLLKVAFTSKKKITPEIKIMKDLSKQASSKKIDKNTDKSHIDNVVSTSHTISSDTTIQPRIPQPIRIVMLQEQEEDIFPGELHRPSLASENGSSPVLRRFDADFETKMNESGELIQQEEKGEEEEGFFFDYDYEDDDQEENEDPQNEENNVNGGNTSEKSVEKNRFNEERTKKVQNKIEETNTRGGEDGSESNEKEDEEDDKLNVLPIGKKLKNPNLFHERLKRRDPVLFLTKEGDQDKYSRLCQSNMKRQPVVLTKDEFDKINRENPGSYTEYIKYGSRPDNQNYYICPRYWCLISNTSMTEEDVIAGKCAKQGRPDKIIPSDASVVPNDAFVYEFSSNKEHIDNKGKYIHHYPGLSKSGRHFYPCCFKKPKKNVMDEQVEPTDEKEEDEEEKEEKEENKKLNEPTQITHVPKTAQVKPINEDERNKQQNKYIISNETFPIKFRNRFGFLPYSIQSFFQYNNYNCISKNNPAYIKPNTECLLRYSVEQHPNQSIFGFFADLYANTQGLNVTPTVQEFKEILKTKITIDKFIRYNNSHLVSVFRPNIRYSEYTMDFSKYTETELYKSIDPTNDYQKRFLEDTITSYENFLEFLSSNDAKIDHTYLWDIITDDNENIIKGGINLIILEITDNDITDNISVLCPTNSQFKRIFDPRKRSAILIKYGEFYEPICLYKEVSGEIRNPTQEQAEELSAVARGSKIKTTKTFLKVTAMKNLNRVLDLIERTTKSGCRNLPSMPNVYKFKPPISLYELFIKLKSSHFSQQPTENLSTSTFQFDEPLNYTILKQVTNYQGKVIGILTRREDNLNLDENINIFVPCSPSAKIKEMDDIPSIFIDHSSTDEKDQLWNDYQTTIKELIFLSKLRTTHEEESTNNPRNNVYQKPTSAFIPCSPKLKVIEDGLIVGIITETNQFIQIDPPSENIHEDEYPTINSSNHFIADREITTTSIQDEEREKSVMKINAETQFYYLFRSIIRELLNQYENRNIKKKIKQIYENPNILYLDKLRKYVEYLKKLADGYIRFAEMDESVLMDIGELSCFSKNEDCSQEDKKKYCIQRENGECSLVIPNNHLLMPNLENETIYFYRMADELLRNNRIRTFMTEPESYLNITDNEYKINGDEFILLQSTLQTDYLKTEPAYNTSEYIKNITYNTADPQVVTQKYSNEAVTLEKQAELVEESSVVTDNLNDNILECIVSSREVIGNQQSLWKRIFSKYNKENKEKTKEIVFKNNIGNCTFYILIYIFQKFYKEAISLHSLKISLINGYKKYWGKYSRQIIKTLKGQGKEHIAKKMNEDNLDEIILDQNYYLTDLDVWIFSDIAELQICIFNPNKLRGTNIEWRIMGNKYEAIHYFIRSGAFIRANKPTAYHLITPEFKLETLTEFYKIVQPAISGRNPDLNENVLSLEDFLKGN